MSMGFIGELQFICHNIWTDRLQDVVVKIEKFLEKY